jgi:hypothetical protein
MNSAERNFRFGHQGEVNHFTRALNFFVETKPEDFNKTFFMIEQQLGLINSIQMGLATSASTVKVMLVH